ncbi:MAG: 16S rRNA (guanine(966)-N(2))-methyltransferase RsmD [Gemmatimonas sp.]|nr:16S rRNA (guanine(966)-N(2))-methyltransferase RsmD [Gemmatimonas sp.]
MRVIGGQWRGRRISAPPGRETRPTTDRVREAWMSALSPWLEGAEVLDLFAGSGALGIEALSRGAARATFVEIAPAALRVLKANLERLGVNAGRATVVRRDACDFARRTRPATFTLAFADPPYGSGAAGRLAELFRHRPFARVLGIEHSREERIPEGPDLRQRSYGDTRLSFLTTGDDPD